MTMDVTHSQEKREDDNNEVKLRIASVERDVDIVGILHQKDAKEKSESVALILHGLMAHKNQTFHKQLAASLPIDSFRFDFRGNGETGGSWGICSVSQDVEDLQVVVHHLRTTLGYRVELIVGHSRGSLDAWTYVGRDERLRRDDENDVPFLVSVSGRWKMERIMESSAYQNHFATQGFLRWTAKNNGNVREYFAYPNDMARWAAFPIQRIVRRVPSNTNVLIIHGTADRTVPVEDAKEYFEQLQSDPRRAKDAQQIRLIEGSDHTLKRHCDEVVAHIVQWYADQKGRARQSSVASTSSSRL